MTCDRRRLSYYVDGELSSDEVQELRSHLHECEPCLTVLSSYRRLGQQIRGEPLPPLPPGFARRVYDRVPPESRGA